MKKPNNIVRITSGRFRGQILHSPQNSATHPMGAREKLALFNMVNVENAVVLDAYAGSGALGLEALSRHAKEVVFVETNRKATKAIQTNLSALQQTATVHAEKMLSFCQNSTYRAYFDVIIADPPYDQFMQLYPNELQLLRHPLKSDGTIVVSSPSWLDVPELSGLRISSTHTYAQARLTVYRAS